MKRQASHDVPDGAVICIMDWERDITRVKSSDAGCPGWSHRKDRSTETTSPLSGARCGYVRQKTVAKGYSLYMHALTPVPADLKRTTKSHLARYSRDPPRVTLAQILPRGKTLLLPAMNS